MSDQNYDMNKNLAAALGVSPNDNSGAHSNHTLPGGGWPIVKGLWYNRQVIKLDGWHFENCRFDHCVLVAESQFFSVKNCFIDNTNKIDLRPPIMGVVQLAGLASVLNGAFIAQPVWSQDGTVSFGVGSGYGY